VTELLNLWKYAQKDPTQVPIIPMFEECNFKNEQGVFPPMLGLTLPN